jgi:hypothetical protein
MTNIEQQAYQRQKIDIQEQKTGEKQKIGYFHPFGSIRLGKKSHFKKRNGGGRANFIPA